MPDLTVHLPNHGYVADAAIFVSWLNRVMYVSDPNQNSFKLDYFEGVGWLAQFESSITDGYVRADDETAGAAITGLDHLEGETVYLLSNGVFYGSYIVASGGITAPIDVTTYQIGLPYTAKIRTMRLEIPAAPTIQSRIKRVNEVTTRYVRTEEGRAGQEYGGIEYAKDLNAVYSNESADVTSLTEAGFNEDAYTVLRSEKPWPMTVLSTIVSFEVEEKR